MTKIYLSSSLSAASCDLFEGPAGGAEPHPAVPRLEGDGVAGVGFSAASRLLRRLDVSKFEGFPILSVRSDARTSKFLTTQINLLLILNIVLGGSSPPSVIRIMEYSKDQRRINFYLVVSLTSKKFLMI